MLLLDQSKLGVQGTKQHGIENLDIFSKGYWTLEWSVASIRLEWKQNFLYINGLVQERRNYSALAMELRLSCTDPST